MRYSTIVERNEESLLEIISALEQFEKDRFIAGIQSGRFTKYEIEEALDLVHIYQSKMNIEARALAKFSEHFIQEFATENNKCFDAAERYFNRIRSTLAALKKVFKKTCPRSMAQLPVGVKSPSVFERSPYSHGACVIDMFGLESYDELVQALYEDLDTLLSTATSILSLCHRMLEDEQNTRQGSEQLRKIYRESCDHLMGSVREFASLMGTPRELPEHELSKRKAKARSMDEFLSREYHNVPKNEFKKFVWLEAVRKGQHEGLTEEELFLWGDNAAEKVEQVRWVIAHYDDLAMEGQQGKLESLQLVYFLKWCGVRKSKEKRLYTYFCSHYTGRYQPLVWSAVSKQRKELVDMQVSDKSAAADFERQISALNVEAV